MDRWEGKVAVVTGANGGIGAAITEDLVKAGVLVVGLDKRLERLEKLSTKLKTAKGKLYARKCELRSEEELLSAFKFVNVEFGGVDILVNNAGLFSNAKVIEDDVDSFRKILDVNVLAMAISIREAVASMKNRDVAGHIISLNSVAGHVVPSAFLPLSLYTPSKYAVTALMETVRKELAAEAKNKIKITSISPGVVKTEVYATAGCVGADEWLETIPHLVPENISEAVLYILGTPDKVQVTELTIRALNDPY